MEIQIIAWKSLFRRFAQNTEEGKKLSMIKDVIYEVEVKKM